MADIGKTYEAPYPFIRTTVDAFWDIDDPQATIVPKVKTWRPGVEHADDDYYDRQSFADGMGHVLLTVIQRVEMPGRYQDRVFYTRQWRDPDGKVFGKNDLRMTTATAFARMLLGYRHPFEMSGELVSA